MDGGQLRLTELMLSEFIVTNDLALSCLRAYRLLLFLKHELRSKSGLHTLVSSSLALSLGWKLGCLCGVSQHLSYPMAPQGPATSSAEGLKEPLDGIPLV